MPKMSNILGETPSLAPDVVHIIDCSNEVHEKCVILFSNSLKNSIFRKYFQKQDLLRYFDVATMFKSKHQFEYAGVIRIVDR